MGAANEQSNSGAQNFEATNGGCEESDGGETRKAELTVVIFTAARDIE